MDYRVRTGAGTSHIPFMTLVRERGWQYHVPSKQMFFQARQFGTLTPIPLNPSEKHRGKASLDCVREALGMFCEPQRSSSVSD